MSVEQLALDCEPDWDDDEDDEPGFCHPDLRSQGLTAAQLRTMTDVPVSRRYL
ncbi:hypothetical protein [Streptomyces purpurascens]|uniref:hypothetical protein n=1 Tax=Streptomyces purpurascens TaxID=1924 RepID=UPI00167A0B2D|nr:hypothetical protein [Streptomyces purpurascens]MCE7049528.1 hypothetical protein [Streptomyces purpurascens]GHA22344.1 hypothetical protein GCM10010303_36070 [Streptomyces purpurascens]